MEPRIVEHDERTIAGMVYYGNPFQDAEVPPQENQIGKLWGRFNTYLDGHRQAAKHTVDTKVGWELHIGTDEYEATKECFVMVGIEVSQIEDLPAPIFAKVFPAGHFAVFTLVGALMNSDWGKAICDEWLPSSAYEEAYSCTFERYDDDRFKGWGDPESEVEIWVPVKGNA